MRQKSYEEEACLYLIPTPIGNMDDITLRAIQILDSVDFLLCEDTRVTSELLHHLNIKKKMYRCDEHQEEAMKKFVLENLEKGKKIGFVSDRGTPMISDPGYRISEFVISSGYAVISLPGPTAFVPALTMSGLAPAPFTFYGFLNAKSAKRKKELENLKNMPYTIIFYEAPHRILEMLEDILEVFGDRKIALCREISKKYEEVIRGSISSILPIVSELKGEMVVVVEGNTKVEDFSLLTIIEHVNLYVEDGMDVKDAIKKVAVERNIPKSVVYKEYHIGK